MDHFSYKSGELYCEDIPVRRIADDVGTPAYVYSQATLLHHYDRLAEAFAELDPLICFSIKSCQNLHICRLLAERGAGFDVVSGGELFRAAQAGGDMNKIVFAGVGKTEKEINEALTAGIRLFNVESEEEIDHLARLAQVRDVVADAALRVNPDVDPKTHLYTTTGKKETKFGVDIERAKRAFETYGRRDGLRLSAIHLHIGSPVNSIEPYVAAIKKGLDLIDELRAAGFGIDTLNIGGGFGAFYEGHEAPLAADYAQAIVPLLKDSGLRIILEPGRSISANAGILVSRAQYIKSSGDKQFVIVDAAMSDLIRPALYGGYHFIWPVNPGPDHVPPNRRADLSMEGAVKVDVVGPVCESGDFLAKDRMIPPVLRGDLVAVFSAGAYGFVMSSQYNSRPRAPEILVDGDGYRVIRRRETYDDLIAAEQIE
jgi:diaminopimelate decarboxylase